MKNTFILLIFPFIFFSCDDVELGEKGENETLISKYSEDESHYKDQNCMNCHYTEGPGEGWFSVAGSASGNYNLANIELYEDKSKEPILKVQYDRLGNAYTTQSVDFSKGLYVGVRNSNGVLKFKQDKIFNGQCNLCHGTNVATELIIK